MRATMAMMATVALMGCNLAQVGGEGPSSCQLAAQHLASCLGASDIEILGTCDAAAQAQADAVLQQSCNELVSSNERSPMFLNNLLCGLLPFLCPNNGNTPGQPGPGQPAAQPNIYRVGDCWRDPNPQTGFCFDIVKINQGQGCTEMLERIEW